MVNNKWDLVDLRVFCQVAQRSSFVAAASHLGISPAYVTKRILNLEKALGVSLFHRTTRRVLISDAGEAAYTWAKKVLAAADEFGEIAGGPDVAPSGLLRISSSLRLGRNHISPILALLNEMYPSLEIWLELMDRRVDMLGEGFDIDVRMGDVNEPHLIAHPVASNARVLCAAPGYLSKRGRPKCLADLTSHDCLLYRDRNQTFGVWRMSGPNGLESTKVTGPMGSNHADIVLNWALEGRGIILLASWDVAALLNSGKLERVLPDYHQPADIWAVTPARLDTSTKLRICTQFLISHLRQGPHAVNTSIR
ncbi:LysR substrate-binding domain-containing protein [Undibacterium sp. SXout7W]|uniref:LysR substrate-binding domain-containing protein n=1 Tax=Undibacterium sp. SXout7W TaxID=3413049 RepID=UPI003BF061FA